MSTYLSPGVYVEEVDSGARPIEGVGTAVAAFVGFTDKGPVNEPVLVTNWAQFTQTFGEFSSGSYLSQGVYGYFMNGGGACYVVRVGENGGTEEPAQAALASAAKRELEAFRVKALEPGASGNDLSVEIKDVTDGKDGKDQDDSDGGDDKSFTLIVKKGDRAVETFENLSTDARTKTYVVNAVNEASKLIQIEEAGKGTAAELKPRAGTVRLGGGGAVTVPEVSAEHYVGDVADRSGLGALEAVDVVTMVCCPDLVGAHEQGVIDLDGLSAVHQAMIAHCELMGDRIAILDAPSGFNAQQVHDWRMNGGGYDSKQAALYWPWITVADPVSGDMIPVPPSGHVAGIYGRSDATRGVHKAPANEVVRGAVGLEMSITGNEHDLLNPRGINCIRAFPGRGIRVWGARTLSSEPAWRYLNVRRLFNYLEESILEGTQWAVFEPNDHALWAKLRRTISSFLRNEWRKGALFGLTPEQAFYVKCDAETNPPDVVDAGMVVCEIGVAPVKPAEFVVFRLSQFSDGAAVEE